MNLPKIFNQARDFKNNNPNVSVYDFLNEYNYTQQALGTHDYNFLVRKLGSIFKTDPSEIKLRDQLF